MVLELAALLGNGVVKTAAADEEAKCKCTKGEDCKKHPGNRGCGCKGDADKCKCKKEDKKPDKKSFVMTGVLENLVKLAGELDDIGADEASNMVDEALKIIVKNLERKNAMYAEDEGPEEVGPEATEAFEEEGPVTGREEGAGSRVERTLQEPEEEGTEQPRQESTPEGLGMSDFGEPGVMEDKMDQLSPEERATLKELLGKLV